MSLIYIVLAVGVSLLGFYGPKVNNFIGTQNQFFDSVNMYTPDVEDLEDKEITTDFSGDILDPDTGKLK